MLANGVLHTITAGGTGSLTLGETSGWPGLRDAYGTTGTRRIHYTLRDAAGVPRETGFGTVDLSATPLVLARTRLMHTWNGTTYDDRTPTAQSAGTDWTLIIAPVAHTTMLAMPPGVRSTALGTRGMSPALRPANATFTLATQQLVSFVCYWPWSDPFDRVRVRASTANTGGSGYAFAVAIHELTGTMGAAGAGNRLALFDTWATNPLTVTSDQLSNPIATPISLTPGFFLFSLLPQWTGGTGTPVLVAGGDPALSVPGLFGTNTGGANRATHGGTAASQTAIGTSLPALTPFANIAQGLPYLLFDIA